jgi:uncharacterized protein
METSKFGLKDKILQEISSVFQSFPEIDSVVIYGSRAKGNYKTGSDIDLTFKGKHLTLNTINKVSLKLDNLYLPWKFDLSIYSQIDNPELIDQIDRVGLVFYSKL